MKEFKIIVESISIEGEVIEFDPPVYIDVVENEPSDYFSQPNYRFIWDFGMVVPISLRDFYKIGDSFLKEKARKRIDFDLCHTFFHPQQDPNYSVLNWALYGNLKNRIKSLDKIKSRTIVE